MKNKYLLVIAFFIFNILNAQTSLTFTADTAVDNGQNITETTTSDGVTYILTATASVDAQIDNLGGADNIFFANQDTELRPWIITLTADGTPINFTLTEIDYDTLETGSISITNQDDAIITPNTSYDTGNGSILPANTINATNITSFNIVPSDNDDLNDFGFHNIDITVPPFTVTWTGNTDNNWFTASNWDTGSIPFEISDVTIPDGLTNYPTISSAVTVNSININSGASLIANASVTGSVTYNRNLPTTNWYLVSSPVNGETAQDIIANHMFATGTPPNIGIGLYSNSTSQNWLYSTNTSTGLIPSGAGASMKFAAPGDLSYTGNLNVTNITIPILTGSEDNFNLLGNPYTSYINSTVLAANNAAIENATFWLWDGSQYVTYNNVSPIDIAPAQGFFVEASESSNVTFSAANQSHQTIDTFQKEEPIANFELSITNGNSTSSTKVFYIAGKATGFDSGYDSKMFGGVATDFAVYTDLVTDSTGEKLAIQTLPTDNVNAIPVGIIASAGETITFSAESVNLPEGSAIYLEDKVTGTFTNLSEETYEITLENDTEGTGQFYIVTQAKSLSTEDLNLDTVSIYKSAKNEITVSGLNTEATVAVYSLVGKQVVTTTVSPTSNKVNLPSLNTGIYIIKLTSDLGEVTKKIILE